MTLARVRPTRVYRFYRGGALIDRLRGQPEQDGDRPEDWVGSVVAANNPGRREPEAGLTRLENGALLRDAIHERPAHWGTPNVLVKLLDPVERLPVHAHPDRHFARAHLGSDYGKTEAWKIVATRDETSDVWLGLSEDVEPERYRAWIEEQHVDALLGSLHHLVVRPGDLVFVPAGVPHAIGGGALIVELQEPTDFSILCEWKGFPVDPHDAHLGLGWGFRRKPRRSSRSTNVPRPPAASRCCSCSRAKARSTTSPCAPATRSPCPRPHNRSTSTATCGSYAAWEANSHENESGHLGLRADGHALRPRRLPAAVARRADPRKGAPCRRRAR